MKVYQSDNMTVYLLKDKIVVEFINTVLREPLLPHSQLYVIELSEILGIRLIRDKVILVLRDGTSLELDVNDPYGLVKDLVNIIKSE